MRHNQYGLGMVILLLMAMAISTTFSATVTAAPTAATQTLMTRLTPESPTIGQPISWLIWTDPSLPGQTVTLTIIDRGSSGVSNNTVVYSNDVALNTTNYSGAFQLMVDTTGFAQHVYKFVANVTVGDMELQSMRYISFSSTGGLFMFASASPSSAIPGDPIDLEIESFDLLTFGHVAATVDIILRNTTDSVIQSWSDVIIPSSNGTRVIQVQTTGLDTGSYTFSVNATSTIGNDTDTASLTLRDIIVDVEEFLYYIGDTVNVSIRTYPSVTQSGLKITYLNLTSFETVTAVDQNVSLTNGLGTGLFNTDTWKPADLYEAEGNVTVASKTTSDSDFFTLDVFSVDVDTDKSTYFDATTVQVTTETTPAQNGAPFIIKVTNSTDDVVWTIGPSALGSDGTAVNQIDVGSWPVDSYSVESSVNSTVQGTLYIVNGTSSFDIANRTFNIHATLSSHTFSGYVLPVLSITTSPGQTDANITITIDGSYAFSTDEEFIFKKTQFDSTQYLYELPLPIAPNGTRIVEVQIDSQTGTNSTSTSLSYTHTNEVVVSEPFLLQTALLVGLSPLFYVAIRKRRQSALSE